MNDTGWGCAYRSLQTCHSWFYLANKTDKKPPTHQEIQKTLVRLGDKEKSFINSREVKKGLIHKVTSTLVDREL